MRCRTQRTTLSAKCVTRGWAKHAVTTAGSPVTPAEPSSDGTPRERSFPCAKEMEAVPSLPLSGNNARPADTRNASGTFTTEKSGRVPPLFGPSERNKLRPLCLDGSRYRLHSYNNQYITNINDIRSNLMTRNSQLVGRDCCLEIFQPVLVQFQIQSTPLY